MRASESKRDTHTRERERERESAHARERERENAWRYEMCTADMVCSFSFTHVPPRAPHIVAGDASVSSVSFVLIFVA